MLVFSSLFSQCCITSNESFPCLHYQFPLVHFTPARLIRVLPQINICLCFKNKGLHPAVLRCARLPCRLMINLVIRVFTRESTGICLYDVQEITDFFFFFFDEMQTYFLYWESLQSCIKLCNTSPFLATKNF